MRDNNPVKPAIPPMDADRAERITDNERVEARRQEIKDREERTESLRQQELERDRAGDG